MSDAGRKLPHGPGLRNRLQPQAGIGRWAAGPGPAGERESGAARAAAEAAARLGLPDGPRAPSRSYTE